jgi:hypothetical protein
MPDKTLVPTFDFFTERERDGSSQTPVGCAERAPVLEKTPQRPFRQPAEINASGSYEEFKYTTKLIERTQNQMPFP